LDQLPADLLTDTVKRVAIGNKAGPADERDEMIKDLDRSSLHTDSLSEFRRFPSRVKSRRSEDLWLRICG
jgi:hypothetical protein